MLFDIITGAIVCVASFARRMFTPESTIASVYFLGEFCGVRILLIEPILSVMILILFILIPNHHSYPFSLPQTIFL